MQVIKVFGDIRCLCYWNKEHCYIEIEINPVLSHHLERCQTQGELLVSVHKALWVEEEPGFCSCYQSKAAVWYIPFLLNEKSEKLWSCQWMKWSPFLAVISKSVLVSLRLYYCGQRSKWSTPLRCLKPFATHQALNLFILPSMSRLRLKARFAVKIVDLLGVQQVSKFYWQWARHNPSASLFSICWLCYYTWLP